MKLLSYSDQNKKHHLEAKGKQKFNLLTMRNFIRLLLTLTLKQDIKKYDVVILKTNLLTKKMTMKQNYIIQYNIQIIKSKKKNYNLNIV